MGIRQLEVELDAKVIVGLLKSNFTPNFAYAPLLSDCRYLLGKLPQVRVSHVFREANKKPTSVRIGWQNGAVL